MGLFRLARLSRLARIMLLLKGENKKTLDANITSGGDALWYLIVTITPVGYGDFFPVTAAGRVTAMFIMFMGVGIIGALASILASLLVGGSPPEEEETPDITPAPSVEEELVTIKAELAVMHQGLENMAAELTTK